MNLAKQNTRNTQAIEQLTAHYESALPGDQDVEMSSRKGSLGAWGLFIAVIFLASYLLTAMVLRPDTPDNSEHSRLLDKQYHAYLKNQNGVKE